MEFAEESIMPASFIARFAASLAKIFFSRPSGSRQNSAHGPDRDVAALLVSICARWISLTPPSGK